MPFKKTIALCGACIGLYIGLGFASMQEVLQYEASYGSLFWVVIAVMAAIYPYTNLSFSANGARQKLERGGDICKVHRGKKAGVFCDWLVVLLGELGAMGCLHDARRGMLLSSLFIFGAAALCCVALISNIDLVWDAPIPMLVLANGMGSALGLAFTVVFFVGI